MNDVVVIGAGVSGMTCALALAKSGRSVRIVESSSRTAPVIRGFKLDGRHFDCGFHYAGSLGEGELFAKVLEYLGVYSKLDVFCLDPDGADQIRVEHPSVHVPIPWGWERVAEALKQRFPEESEGITRYLEMVREIFDDIPKTFAQMDDVAMDKLWSDGMGPSLQEVLDEVTQDPSLQAVLSSHGILYGTRPSETPFIVHARVVGTHYQSLYGVTGGGSAVADAFDEALADNGVEVLTGAEAVGLHVDGEGRVTAVELADGRDMVADSFVFSGHPCILAEMLPQAQRNGRMGKRLRRLEDTFSAYVLFCEIDSVPHCLNLRNVMVRPDLDPEAFRNDVPVVDRGFFASYCQPSGNGAGQTFTVVFPESHTVVDRWKESRYGRRDAEYERFKNETTAAFLDRLQVGIPELAGKVRVIGAATPLTIKHYCHTPDTAGIYGVKHRCGQVPVLPKSRLPNLYVTGQAVVTPGLFGAAYSGLVTVAIMTGGEQLRKDLFK